MRRLWLQQILLPFLLVLSGLIAWQVIEDQVNEQRREVGKTSLEFFIPTPLTIIETFSERYQQISYAMVQTLQKALTGFILGSLFGVTVAILYSLMPGLRAATLPIAFAIQSFPVVGLAPAIVLAFGQDSFMSIVIISAILTYFPILLSLDDGFKNINKDYLELSYIYNANDWQTLRYIKSPLVASALLTSLKLAAPGSIVGATIGEWMGSSSGIGRLITLSLYQLRPGLLYACLFVLAMVSASTVLLINLVEWRFFRWVHLMRRG